MSRYSPSYRFVYSKLNSISSESFPVLGNPNLNPQVSVNYEVGAKHQFLPIAAINLSFQHDHGRALHHQERALALNANDDLIVVQQGEVEIRR